MDISHEVDYIHTKRTTHHADIHEVQIQAYQAHNLDNQFVDFPQVITPFLTNTFHEHDPVQLTPCVVLTTLS